MCKCIKFFRHKRIFRKRRTNMERGIYLLGEIFKRELKKELKKEIKNPEYKPQYAFKNCCARSTSLIHPAISYTEKCFGLAIALHRGNIHNEDTAFSEVGELESSLETRDVEEIKAIRWWNN